MKKRTKRLLIAALIILLAVPVFTGLSLGKLYKASGGTLSFSKLIGQVFTGQLRLKGTTNILLLGIDTEGDTQDKYSGNADGILLISVNADTRELVMTSFMRDIKVSVDPYTRDKLTNVYHEGGIEKFKTVFEDNFGINVDYYALFSYADIIDIIDALGGVEIEVAAEEIPDAEAKIRSVAEQRGLDWGEYMINWYGPGKINMNGVQAAGYMRIRPSYGGYDAGRTSRARYVASRLMDKLGKKSLKGKLDFAQMLLSKISTDMPGEIMLRFAYNGWKLLRYGRISDRIPIDDAYYSENSANGYYTVIDFDVNRQYLYESVYHGQR